MARPKTGGSSRQIIEVASQLFAERGPNGVSIEEIAERVGISRSSIFWHFGSKAGLLEAVVRDIGDRAYALVVAPGTGLTGLAALEAVITERARSISHESELVRLVEVLMGESLTLEPQLAPLFAGYEAGFRARIEEWLVEAREAGELTPGVDPGALATVIAAALSGIVPISLRAGPSFDVAAAHQAVIDVINSVAQPAARRRRRRVALRPA